MARTFGGATTHVAVVSIGATNVVMGPGTIAAIIRITGSTPAASYGLYHAGSASSGTSRWWFVISNADKLGLGFSASTPVSLTSVTSADGWLLVAASKATGTVAPRFHIYKYSTNAWVHENSAGTNANSGTPATNSRIGNVTEASNSFQGDIAVCGVWSVVLADDQVESLPFTLAAWFTAAQPKGLWVLDQDTTSQKILDISGGGANESSLTGTSVATTSVPVFNLGRGVQPVVQSWQKSLLWQTRAPSIASL